MPGDSVPDVVAAREHVRRQLVWFGRRLRAAGASVPSNAAPTAAEALSVVGLAERERVRAALFASLVADERDREAFEAHFPTFWYRLRSGIEAVATGADADDPGEAGQGGGLAAAGTAPDDERARSPAAEGDERGRAVRVAPARETDDERPGEPAGHPGTYSAVGSPERLGADVGERSVTPLVDEHVRQFERAIATLAGRRSRPEDGSKVDGRRTLRRSLATGGVPVELPGRAPATTAFGPTVLADVSRSVLDAVDRGFLLSVLARLHADGRSTRTFLFDTDLREVSDAFADPGDPAAALHRAEVEWGGGTRIGDALATLRGEYADAVDRRTVVVVVSDGLDVGDPDHLESGMVWLARRSRAVLWLNPLAATAGYEPTCRGMATALPYVDGLFAFARSEDLAEVARQLRRRGFGGRLGYQYETREGGGRA